MPQGWNTDWPGDACLCYRPFQCSLPLFLKGVMPEDNVGLRAMGTTYHCHMHSIQGTVAYFQIHPFEYPQFFRLLI